MRTLILSLEDTDATLHRRLRSTVATEYPGGLSPVEMDQLDNLNILSLAGVASPLDVLADALKGAKEYDLIFIDPLAHCLPAQGDSINTAEGANFIHNLLWDIVASTPGHPSVAMAHHVPKHIQLGGQHLDQTAASGSHLLVDLARFSINLTKLTRAEVAKFNLEKGAYIQANIPKVNNAPELEENVTFRRGNGGALVHVSLPSQSSTDAKRVYQWLRRQNLPLRQKAVYDHFTSSDLDGDERVPRKRLSKAIEKLLADDDIQIRTLDEKGKPKEIFAVS